MGYPDVPICDMRIVAARISEMANEAPIELEVNGWSTGNALMPILWNGSNFRFFPDWNGGTNNPWMALFFSTRNTAGQYDQILGYYPEQFAIPSPMHGNVLLEQSVEDYADNPNNIPAITPAMLTPTADISAFDMHIGSILDSGGAVQPGLIETTDSLFFTLTPNSASALNAQSVSWNSKPGGGTWKITAATIFCATWSGGQVTVEVKHDWTTLGIPSEANVDALAVGRGFNTQVGGASGEYATQGLFYVFSCEKTVSVEMPSQFMCCADVLLPAGTASRTGALHDVDNAPLDPRLGIGNDDVDGLCAHDPEGFPKTLTDFLPIDNVHTSLRLGFSGVRAWRSDDGPITSLHEKPSDFHFTVSGWGGSAPITQPREVWLQVRYEGQSSLLLSSLVAVRPANTGTFRLPKIAVPAGFDSTPNDYEVRIVQRVPNTTANVERTFWSRISRVPANQ